MRRNPIFLFALLVTLIGWVAWARWPVVQQLAASQPVAHAQSSPLPTPTPPLAMPTPAVTRAVEDDWPRYTSPYLGFSFRYPPEWSVEGPETRLDLANMTEQIRYANLLGPPMVISPSSEKSGVVSISLQSYRRLPETPLGEWVLLENEFYGRHGMWGFSPIELATMPASYLPVGMDAGIYTTNDNLYVEGKTFWLQRGDLVYRLSSTYHRPEDVALILAIIQTLEFDPTVEETLRAANAFSGTDANFRQQLEPKWTAAAITPSPTPACDEACEHLARYIQDYIVPMETANALPAIERPQAHFIEPLPVGDDWPTYEQTLMGITFRHPPEWEVEDPFKEHSLGEKLVLNTAISIHPKGAPDNRKFSIILSPYTISDDTPLTNWVALNDQRTRNASNSYLAYNLSIPPDPSYLPRQARDLVHIQLSVGDSQANTIWVSMDNLVYWVLIQDATALPAVGAVLSTLEFDREQLAKLHAETPFLGDERQMAREMVNAWVTPTLAPTPTPSPTVRATVTPSAFESPLIGGLQQYHGTSNDDAHTPYRLLFDPAVWQWVANEDGRNQLTHHHFISCELVPGYGIYEVPILAPVELAGQEWATYYWARRDEVAQGLMYSVGWEGGYFQALLSLSEPLPAPYDPARKSQCQLAAEAVLDTFTYQATPITPTSTPRPGMPMPTVTPTP